MHIELKHDHSAQALRTHFIGDRIYTDNRSLCKWANLHPLDRNLKVTVNQKVCTYAGIIQQPDGSNPFENVEFFHGYVEISANPDEYFAIAIPKENESSLYSVIIDAVDRMEESNIDKFEIYSITKNNLDEFASLSKQKSDIKKALGKLKKANSSSNFSCFSA